LRELIIRGGRPGQFKSRSEHVWRVVCELARLGMKEHAIAGVLMESDFAVSESVLDKPHPRQYAMRQAERAIDAENASFEIRGGRIRSSFRNAQTAIGASRLQTFRFITLPYLASAIVTGAVLALTLSFDETLISVFLAGDRMTLPLRLWAMMRVGFSPEINALVTLVLLVSLVLAALVAARLRIGNSNPE
ncbi:MAG: ABC transporter permease subunit, partial [Alphaproteobacteria bacterium]